MLIRCFNIFFYVIINMVIYMLYRKANNDDADKLDNLLTKLITDEKNYDPKVELINVKDFYTNFIDDESKYFEVCEDNNEIVGYIYSKLEENNAKIDALFVEEAYRNKKIATTLIENFINYCKDNNIKEITIKVLENNIKAKSLYSKYFILNNKEGIKEELILNL